MQGLNIDEANLESRDDKSNWQLLYEIFQKKIAEKDLSEWVEIFHDLDACVTPVLELSQLSDYPHHASRDYLKGGGIPAPAPRFQNRTFLPLDDSLLPGQHSLDIVKDVLGMDEKDAVNLIQKKALIQAKL